MEENKTKNKLVPIIVILLLLSLAGNVFLFMNKQAVVEEKDDNIAQILSEKSSLDTIYFESKAENERLKGDNEKLNTVLGERDKEMEASKKRIEEFVKTIKDKDVLIKKIKAEKEAMKKKVSEYEDRIDQLLMENKELTIKKQQLEEELGEVTDQRDLYKNKADIGAKLKAEYVQTKAYKDRMFGDGEKPTSLAKRTKKIDVCFSVLKNEIAANGAKTVYLRLITPSGQVMGNPAQLSGQFTSPESKEEIKFSSKREFTYTGNQQDLCLSYEDPKEKAFPAGEYTVEVYVDKMLSSKTKYTLK